MLISRCLQHWHTKAVSESFVLLHPSLQPTRSCLLQRRCLLTVAIETSWYRTISFHGQTQLIKMYSDDTSVAVLETHSNASERLGQNASFPAATLHFHDKVTADNSKYRGIHPVTALESHQENLACLIANAISSLPPSSSSTAKDLSATVPVFSGKEWLPKKKPDFISVTRGPGMRSSLFTGLDTAKGLAVAWQVPLVGVNHMQAHALTPRLVSALASGTLHPTPAFPFLSLLVSGGHTLLLHSKALNDHSILASTMDIAIGDVLDKIARCVLTDAEIMSSGEIMYGRTLERFAFPDLTTTDYKYTSPSTRGEELARKETRWGWSLPVMLAETRSGSQSRRMEYTFCGLGSAVQRLCDGGRVGKMSTDERVELAREAMRVAFEHLASRIVLALHQRRVGFDAITTLVVSGGVASNQYLRTMYVILRPTPSSPLPLFFSASINIHPLSLRSYLDAHGYNRIQLSFPPPALCVDNAAMIAWAGMEMYTAGWTSALSCTALRKWSLDPEAEDGGILGVGGWVRRGD